MLDIRKRKKKPTPCSFVSPLSPFPPHTIHHQQVSNDTDDKPDACTPTRPNQNVQVPTIKIMFAISANAVCAAPSVAAAGRAPRSAKAAPARLQQKTAFTGANKVGP